MNKIFGLLAPAVALTAAAVAGTGAAAAQAAPAAASHTTSHATSQVKPFDGVFEPIRNVGNGLCLEPTQPAGPNSPVVQEPCAQPNSPGNDFILQGWQTVQLSGSTYKFINNGSGACLFAFTSAHNGAPMGLDTCRNVSNEEFDAHTTLPNVSVLESKIGFSDTGFCMDVPGASSATGLQLQLFNCNGTLAQRWVIGFPPPAP